MWRNMNVHNINARFIHSLHIWYNVNKNIKIQCYVSLKMKAQKKDEEEDTILLQKIYILRKWGWWEEATQLCIGIFCMSF